MKRVLYILFIALVASASIASCTEENIKPKTETTNNGGGNSSETKGT